MFHMLIIYDKSKYKLLNGISSFDSSGKDIFKNQYTIFVTMFKILKERHKTHLLN